MELVFVVVWCNCTIACLCLGLSLWLVGFRRQLVSLTKCCDRWTVDLSRFLADAPESLAINRAQIRYLREVYQQQSVRVDRIRQISLVLGIIRSWLRVNE